MRVVTVVDVIVEERRVAFVVEVSEGTDPAESIRLEFPRARLPRGLRAPRDGETGKRYRQREGAALAAWAPGAATARADRLRRQSVDLAARRAALRVKLRDGPKARAFSLALSDALDEDTVFAFVDHLDATVG